MELDDLLSTESAVVAAVTAAIFSPRTRETMRRGAVLGLAGAMKAGDVVAGAARGVVRGARAGARATAETTTRAGDPAVDAGASPVATSPSRPARSSTRSSGTATAAADERLGA